MGKRKGLEETWQGPQYTFRPDDLRENEEMRKPSKEEMRESAFEEMREQADPLRKFNAMLPETLFFEWKTYCTKKRCKMQNLTAQALRRYMEENP
jgi:hypothetical protein